MACKRSIEVQRIRDRISHRRFFLLLDTDQAILSKTSIAMREDAVNLTMLIRFMAVCSWRRLAAENLAVTPFTHMVD